MKKIARFIIEKWYGAAVAWLCWGAVVLVYCLIAGPYRCVGYLTTAMIGLHGIGALVLLAVVVHSLVKRRWGRAVGQFLLGLGAVVVYGVALIAVSLVTTFSERNMNDFDRTKEPWYGTKPCETVPFGVEFRIAHPFLAEYSRRVVFKSGKPVMLNQDTGGAGEFAIYALKDGNFLLMDGLRMLQHRNEYRVNASVESVERRCGRTWVRIPDDTLDIYSWNSESFGVKTTDGGDRSCKGGASVGDTLESKRYLGRVTTKGEFVAGGEEPYIEKNETSWKSSEITDTIPFAYETGKSKTEDSLSRIGFKSGKKVVLMGDWRHGTHEVYRMEDGRFILSEQEGTMWESTYVIDATEESVSTCRKGFVARIPDNATRLCGVAEGKGRGSIEVETEKGKVVVRSEERIAAPYLGSEHLGRIESDGSFTPSSDAAFATALQRATSASSEWDDAAESRKMGAVINEILKGDRKAVKERIGALPGWEVSYAGKRGYLACRVFHSGKDSCVVSFGIDEEKPVCIVSARGRSANEKAAHSAAAIAAAEELSALKARNANP